MLWLRENFLCFTALLLDSSKFCYSVLIGCTQEGIIVGPQTSMTLSDIYLNAVLTRKCPILEAERQNVAHEFDEELRTVMDSADDLEKKIAALYLLVGKLFKLGHKDARVMERTIMVLCIYLQHHGGLERLKHTVIFSDKLAELVRRFQSEAALTE